MEAVQAVEKEQNKVNEKLQLVSDSTSSTIKALINKAESLKSLLSDKTELSPEDTEAVKSFISQVTTEIQGISQTHKDIHASISKYGRVIDKYFIQDNKCAANSVGMITEQNKHLLNRSIYEHLLREGRMDVAETLMKEANLSREEGFVTLFTEIHHVVLALRNRDLGPALEWVEGHREDLLQHNSSLEFKLKQRKYLQLLTIGHVNEALTYAKELGQFSPQNSKDIQRLMGCLLFIHRGLEDSPYSDLLNPWHWDDVIDTFTRDACCLLGLPLESPLAVAMTIGSAALPQLLHLQSVMVQRQMADVLSGRDELPCEIQLPWKHRYHSIFTCPILRQQTSEVNPPVRLLCGHAISRDAMRKLVSHSGRLKCPYCPIDMMAKDVQVLNF